MHITKIMLIVLLTSTVIMPVVAADNMRLHGALVEEPCTLQPGDESVELDFGTIVDKYLYQYQRTLSKPFQLHLVDCDTSLGKTVKISFGGTESAALPGLLALDAGNQAQGVAIGLETIEGQSLSLNIWGQNRLLSNGNNIIAMQAYVQGEPAAIANKTIRLGAFSAVAIFTLLYE
jgi:type 1 fimbria pilin